MHAWRAGKESPVCCPLILFLVLCFYDLVFVDIKSCVPKHLFCLSIEYFSFVFQDLLLTPLTIICVLREVRYRRLYQSPHFPLSSSRSWLTRDEENHRVRVFISMAFS